MKKILWVPIIDSPNKAILENVIENDEILYKASDTLLIQKIDKIAQDFPSNDSNYFAIFDANVQTVTLRDPPWQYSHIAD